MKGFKFSKDIHLTKIKLSFSWILFQFFFYLVKAILILLKQKNLKEECQAYNKRHNRQLEQNSHRYYPNNSKYKFHQEMIINIIKTVTEFVSEN